MSLYIYPYTGLPTKEFRWSVANVKTWQILDRQHCITYKTKQVNLINSLIQKAKCSPETTKLWQTSQTEMTSICWCSPTLNRHHYKWTKKKNMTFDNVNSLAPRILTGERETDTLSWPTVEMTHQTVLGQTSKEWQGKQKIKLSGLI